MAYGEGLSSSVRYLDGPVSSVCSTYVTEYYRQPAPSTYTTARARTNNCQYCGRKDEAGHNCEGCGAPLGMRVFKPL